MYVPTVESCWQMTKSASIFIKGIPFWGGGPGKTQGHDGSSYGHLTAIDPSTGEIKWRVERPTDAPREAPDAYTTPALLDYGDGFEIVVSGADYVTGYDPATGDELWRVAGLNPSANPMQRIVASPIVAGKMLGPLALGKK